MEPITVLLLLCVMMLVLTILVAAAAIKAIILTHRHYPMATITGRLTLPRRLPELLKECADNPRRDLFTLEVQAELPSLLADLQRLRHHLRLVPLLQFGKSSTDALVRAAGRFMRDGCYTPDALRLAIPDDASTLDREIFPWLVMCMQASKLHQALLLQQRRMRSTRGPFKRSTSREDGTEPAVTVKHTSSMLSQLLPVNWPLFLEADDPLHQQLLQDPAGVYPLMDPVSRQNARRHSVKLARHIHADPASLCSIALQRASESLAGDDERMVQWWLTDLRGQLSLCRCLPHMLLHTAACLVHTSQAQALLRMTAGTILSFIFLNAGYPLLSLPLFLIILRRLPGMHEGNSALPPAMHLSGIPESCRTLLVMPRILQTQQDALSAAREASTLLHACAQENVDLLLLGDFGSTQWTHHDDSSVIATALASLDALSDSYPDTRILYLQRSRTQNSQSFAGSPGYLSAIRCVCQLIAQGEACDTFVYASFDPSCLHRRYAFVMSLQPRTSLVPGALEALLRVASHPLNNRRPAETGCIGSAVFLPQFLHRESGQSVAHCVSDHFTGTGLIRPDAFLEATDGLVHPDAPSACLIAGQLCNASQCPDAIALLESSVSDAAGDAPALISSILWQLPLVSTPAGMLTNPLPHSSRRKLRQGLYTLLTPAAQLLLILLAGARRDLLLIILAALPDLHKRRSLKGFLHDAARIPGRAASLFLWPLQSLRWKRRIVFPRLQHSDTALQTLFIWSQGLSMAWMLGFALSTAPLFLPGLAISSLFGAYHWLRVTAFPQTETTDPEADALRTSAAELFANLQKCILSDEYLLPPDSAVADVESAFTSPGAIAGSLLACVSARELQLITADAACNALRHVADGLLKLPMTDGLPAHRWHVHSLAVADASITADECGLLMATLITTAQAVRCWMSELSQEHHNLPAILDGVSNAITPSRMLDESSGRFFRVLRADGSASGLCRNVDDAAGLLYICSVIRRETPADILHLLERTDQSTASTPFPADEACISRLNPAGLFLPHAALQSASAANLGILPGTTLHACLRLAAIAHRLCRKPLMRYFCMLPSAHAVLPLLQLWPTSMPFLPLSAHQPTASTPTITSLDPFEHPLSAFVCGDHNTSVAVNSLGSVRFIIGGTEPCSSTSDAAMTSGPQSYLTCAGITFRLMDPLLHGSSIIGGGEVCFTRTCGSIRSSLSLLVDTTSQQLVQEITLFNTAHQPFDLSVVNVLPLHGIKTLHARRPSAEDISITMEDERVLHHAVHSESPVHLSALTNLSQLAEPSGSLRTLHPSCKELPFVTEHPDCAAFLIRFSLQSRSRIVIVVRTGFTSPERSFADDTSSIRRYASAAWTARLDELQLQPGVLAAFAGAVLWSGQERQHACSVQDDPSPAEPCILVDHDAEGDLSLLTEVLQLASCLAGAGFPLRIVVRCASGTSRPDLPDRFTAAKALSIIHLSDQSDTPPFHLHLYSSRGPIASQLSSLRYTLPRLHSPCPAKPASMDDAHAAGIFEPETGDYVLFLPAGSHPPVNWPLRLSSPLLRASHRLWQLDQRMHERLLVASNGAVIDPFSLRYPRRIRISAAFVRWECLAEDLHVQLTAFCSPANATELRRVRVTNQTSTAMDVTLHVTAIPDMRRPSVPSIDGAAAVWDAARCIVTGTDDNWRLMRVSRIAAYGYGDSTTHLPQNENGTALAMSRSIALPPHGKDDASWITGLLPHGAQPCDLLMPLAEGGVSGLLRRVRELTLLWPTRLTVDCGIDAMDQLFNHLLPRQLLGADPACSGAIAMLAFADPDAAGNLLRAILPHAAGELPGLTMAAVFHAAITGRNDVLQLYAQEAADDPGHFPIPRDLLTARDELTAPSFPDHILRSLANIFAVNSAEGVSPQPACMLSTLIHQIIAGEYNLAWKTLEEITPAKRTCCDLLPPFLLCVEQQGQVVPLDSAAGWLWIIMLECFFGVMIRAGVLRLEPHLPGLLHAVQLTLQHGSTTWHISLEDAADQMTLDGAPVPEGIIRLIDDGRIHHIRAAINH